MNKQCTFHSIRGCEIPRLKLCLHSHKQPNSAFHLFLGFSGRQHVSQLLTEWSFLFGLMVFSSDPPRADRANVQIDYKSDFLSTFEHIYSENLWRIKQNEKVKMSLLTSSKNRSTILFHSMWKCQQLPASRLDIPHTHSLKHAHVGSHASVPACVTVMGKLIPLEPRLISATYYGPS